VPCCPRFRPPPEPSQSARAALGGAARRGRAVHGPVDKLCTLWGVVAALCTRICGPGSNLHCAGRPRSGAFQPRESADAVTVKRAPMRASRRSGGGGVGPGRDALGRIGRGEPRAFAVSREGARRPESDAGCRRRILWRRSGGASRRSGAAGGRDALAGRRPPEARSGCFPRNAARRAGSRRPAMRLRHSGIAPGDGAFVRRECVRQGHLPARTNGSPRCRARAGTAPGRRGVSSRDTRQAERRCHPTPYH
jgi:hypothetical protein